MDPAFNDKGFFGSRISPDSTILRKQTKNRWKQKFLMRLCWKQRRQPPLETKTVASTNRSLGMLRWLDVKQDSDLLIAEQELVEA